MVHENRDRLKIALAVHHFPPRYNGGAEWRAHRTARALQERGHQVKVIAVEHIDRPAAGGVAWEDELFEGVNIRRLSFDQRAAGGEFRWGYDHPWIGEHFEQFLGTYRPDVFHLIGGYLLSGSPLKAAKRLGIPTVVTLTDFWFLCPHFSMLCNSGEICTLPIDPVCCARCLGEEKRRYRIPGRLFPALAKLYWRSRVRAVRQVKARMDDLLETLNRVDVIISPSEFLRDFHVAAGVDAGRVVYSRQGRNPAAPSSEPREYSGVLRIGYAGQIAPHKGVHVLIEAARRLPGAALEIKIFGDPQAFPRYTRRLEKLAGEDARIRFGGQYGREDLSLVFDALDVLVVPSLWYENSPNVILEAFDYRVPVITSNIGGMAELVEHKVNGLLFERGSAEDLARQLSRLMETPALLNSLQAGIRPPRSVEEEIDELEELYRRAQSVEYQPA